MFVIFCSQRKSISLVLSLSVAFCSSNVNKLMCDKSIYRLPVTCLQLNDAALGLWIWYFICCHWESAWLSSDINFYWMVSWHDMKRRKRALQYIPRTMHTVFALLCFVVVIHWLIFPYPSGLLHWHCGNLTIVPVPAKQPSLGKWNILIRVSPYAWILTTGSDTEKYTDMHHCWL